MTPVVGFSSLAHVEMKVMSEYASNVFTHQQAEEEENFIIYSFLQTLFPFLRWGLVYERPPSSLTCSPVETDWLV